MHPRRLRSIAQVREADRFGILGEGLSMLAENVHNLTEDIEDRGKNRRFQAAAVLSCFAEEEAAKILILLDIARAGWSDRDAVGRAMDAFYAHLARGLYVRAYDGSPTDLGEVRRYVDSWRQEFYLDGPMDVDWIFNNEVLASREERLYVDYVEFEDGDRRWIGPKQRTALFDEPFMYPPPLPWWSD